MVHPIAEVFLRKISFPKKIVWKTVPWGGPQSETVRFEKNIFFTLNSNISWFLNDKSKIFPVMKKGIWSNSPIIKIFMLKIVYPPLRQPQKDHDFDGFLHFLEKLERSLWTVFWYNNNNNFYWMLSWTGIIIRTVDRLERW